MKFAALIIVGLLVSTRAAPSCEHGTYRSNDTCEPCPKGTFQDERNQRNCIPCQGNTFAPRAGSIKCRRCTKKDTEPSEFKDKCECRRGAVAEGNKCVPCKSGTFFHHIHGRYHSIFICTSCDAGTFQPEDGATSCLPCPKGTTSGLSARRCIVCAENEFASTDGKCKTCPPGEEERTGRCRRCNRNMFKDSVGRGPCLPCPRFSVSDAGATGCIRCPKGTALMESGKCGKCPPGSHYQPFRRECRECRKGSFMPLRNVRMSCFKCAGNENSMAGAKKCVSCPRNQYLMKDGSCKGCPVGTAYNDVRFKCQRCQVNSFSDGTLEYCKPCVGGSFSLPGSATCFNCPRGEALLSGKMGCGKCGPGYEYESYAAKCQLCYKGSVNPEAGVKTQCEFCRSRKSNKERTECIPRKSGKW